MCFKLVCVVMCCLVVMKKVDNGFMVGWLKLWKLKMKIWMIFLYWLNVILVLLCKWLSSIIRRVVEWILLFFYGYVCVIVIGVVMWFVWLLVYLYRYVWLLWYGGDLYCNICLIYWFVVDVVVVFYIECWMFLGGCYLVWLFCLV